MSKQAIKGMIGEFVGVIEVLLQGSHILVASDFNDLVHRLSGSYSRGDKSTPQAMATDIEVIDGLAGSPLDHQIDALGAEWFGHQLTPTIHAPK